MINVGVIISSLNLRGGSPKDQIEQIHCCVRPTDINNESWNEEEQVFKLH